jgi:hypothetical protein
MRPLKLMIPAAGAAMVMLIGLAGPAGAGGKIGIDPGRRNSTGGLATATYDLKQVRSVTRPFEQITENIVTAQDPDQAGVVPGGGGGDCPTC